MTQSKKIDKDFNNLGIDPRLLYILKNNKLITPTPIQAQCIPQVLYGDDIVGIAETGTGKTLAFSLPIIQLIKEKKGQALILVPTRELAIQAEEMIYKIGKNFNIKTSVIIGGSSMGRQIMELRRNPDIIIATPGRLLDHIKRRTINLKNIKYIVLDEADRMFDIGFLPDIKAILNFSPKDRQTLLFSATISSEISHIASEFMKKPVRIEVAPPGTVAKGIKQEIFIVSRDQKISLLKKLIEDNPGTILVFLRTKHSVKKMTKVVSNWGFRATEIHSDRSLNQRKEAMKGFKSGRYRILFATDVASRGIDVSNISIVLNYDLPDNLEDYVHRIGRTGRAGSVGKAISFVVPNERHNIRRIEKLIKESISISKLPTLELVPPIQGTEKKRYDSRENQDKRNNKFSRFRSKNNNFKRGRRN